MTQQTINIGTAPGDGTGDPLRSAMQKVNANFTELYAASSGSSLSTTERRNALLSATMIAANSAAPLDLIDRWADGFASSAGIVSGSSSNYTVTTTGGGSVAPTTAAGSDQIPTMTAATTSGVTMAASTYLASYDPWHAGDKSTAASANCWITNAVTTGWLSVQFSAAKTISSYTVTSLTGYATRAPKNWTLEGSNDGSSWTTLDTQTNITSWTGTETKSYTIASPGSYSYYRLNVSANNGDATYLQVAEITLVTAGVTSNMTLVAGNGLSVEAAPSTIRALVDVTPVDTVTMGTDLTVDVSRDGGTTWTAAGSYTTARTIGSRKIVETDAVSVTGQPSGTSVRARLKSFNNKSLSIGGVAVMWA